MIFGYELIINLKDCNNITRKSLNEFIVKLCKFIKIKRFGKCQIVYFGKDKFRGFSLMQFLTTSSVVGHFTKDEAFINIFSCKEFNKIKTLEFVKNWFNTKTLKYNFLRR